MTTDLSTISVHRRLFAPVSPPNARTGRRFIDYGSISYTAKGAREKAAAHWPRGWPGLLKRGWRIIRVDVSPSEVLSDD